MGFFMREGIDILIVSLIKDISEPVSTNALLHTSVVTSGYFSQSCSSISLIQSAHSPLTSSINKAFSPTGLPHTGCFSLFTPFFVNPRNGCALKSQ